jgi:signal transduction histidine kinase
MDTDTASDNEPLGIEDPIRLIRQMSHDMRIPLGALIATSDLLAEGGYDPLTAKQTRAIDRIQRNSRRLLAILDDLMTYVKAEANQYPLQITSFDPCALLRDALDQVRTVAEQKGLNLLSTSTSSVPTSLIGDQANVKRIIVAMLWNAVTATTKGTISLDAEWSKAQWIIRVRDTGHGIQPENITHVFEPFWRGHERQQAPTSGCGLGLSMAHSLVRLMTGTLTLESTSPEGTVFLIQLPLDS